MGQVSLVDGSFFVRDYPPDHNHFTESKSWIVRCVTSIAWEEEGATNVPDLITGTSENIFSIAKNILFTLGDRKFQGRKDWNSTLSNPDTFTVVRKSPINMTVVPWEMVSPTHIKRKCGTGEFIHPPEQHNSNITHSTTGSTIFSGWIPSATILVSSETLTLSVFRIDFQAGSTT